MKLFLSSTTLAVLPFQGKPRGEQQQSAYHSIALIGLAKKSARATPITQTRSSSFSSNNSSSIDSHPGKQQLPHSGTRFYASLQTAFLIWGNVIHDD